MGRPDRIDWPGAYQHIYDRIIEKKYLLEDPCDKELLFNIMKKYKKRHGFDIISDSILDNHFHFFARSGVVHISKVMHDVLSEFTIKFNKKHDRVGHLFSGRFRSQVVDKETYAKELDRYIEMNAVKAGLVSKPEDYKWCSMRDYLGLREDSIIDTRLILGQFNNVEKYYNFVVKGSADFPKIHKMRNLEIMGEKNFIEDVMQNVKEAKRDKQRAISRIDKNEVIDFVSKEFGLDSEYLLQPTKKRDKMLARRALAYILKEWGHYTLNEISEILNISISSVSNYVIFAEKLDNKDLIDVLDKWVDQIWNKEV